MPKCLFRIFSFLFFQNLFKVFLLDFFLTFLINMAFARNGYFFTTITLLIISSISLLHLGQSKFIKFSGINFPASKSLATKALCVVKSVCMLAGGALCLITNKGWGKR